MATIPDSMTTALQLHQQGQLQDAERTYRQVLDVEPNHADALHFLGMIAAQNGHPEVAVDYMNRSIASNANVPAFHVNLGKVLRELGKHEEAVACYRSALLLMPNSVEAHYNLGNALQEQGKLEDAVVSYRRAVELRPDYAEAFNNLGLALQDMGNHDEAITIFRQIVKLKPDDPQGYFNLGNLLEPEEAVSSFRRALELKPDFAEAYNNLGNTLMGQGKLNMAVACYRRVLDSKPDSAEAFLNLGYAFQAQGKTEQAILCYRHALEVKPEDAEAYNKLGVVLKDQGKLDEAIAMYYRAIELKSDIAEAYNNLGSALRSQGKLEEAIATLNKILKLRPEFAEAYLETGNTYKEQGELEAAIASYRRALTLKPDYPLAHSNLLYTLLYSLEDDLSIHHEHRRWNERHALPLARFIQDHLNDPNPERRIRIGYVSPDFRNHPVGRFMRPLLESHDHGFFEIVCYSDAKKSDSITDDCRAHADLWRDVSGVSTEELAATVREDRIDILVDLAMHTANNRLLLFARKPAPVQVTYLGYPGTTGLTSIDYRLTDPYLDPPGHDDRFYSEQSIRLPETFWCYPPPDEAPPVNDLPALEKKYVTFGCLNNYCKINSKTFQAWVELLKVVPNSRLLLNAHEGTHRDLAWTILSELGIAANRLEFLCKLPMHQYFESYHRIDVALDPFPYGGGTTTCDALWMGVPVVSLVGQRAVGRGGLSILSNLGMPELVAQNVEQYVQIAANLASDLPRLSQIRMDLRDRMRASPLMDAPRFARNVEAAYREMWRRWCTK